MMEFLADLNLYLVLGGIIGIILFIGGIVLAIGTYRKRKKSRSSLAHGSDTTEFTEEFIRQYDNQ